ncbi:unnamed protein product [Cylindrotheca closterium]|uniref:Uncharacterized protein n=1 Tax=Cylindrotheca closterium TaxID=2856 RepID=A0AAD2FG50_9STRA|nr:unnamed protein product [Cylindrotheca closterium]
MQNLSTEKSQESPLEDSARSMVDLAAPTRAGSMKRKSRSLTPKKSRNSSIGSGGLASSRRVLTSPPPRCIVDDDDSSQVSKMSTTPRRNRSSKTKMVLTSPPPRCILDDDDSSQVSKMSTTPRRNRSSKTKIVLTSTPRCILDDDDSSQVSKMSKTPRRNRSSKTKIVLTSPTPRCILDDDDSSQVSRKSTTPRRNRSSKSKVMDRRSASITPKSSQLQEQIQEEIVKLKAIQDQMEEHQAYLEKQHREFERQIHTMELCLEMSESKNVELESQLEEALEENDRLSHGRRSRFKSIPSKKFNYSSNERDDVDEVELLRLENEILQGKLQRCEVALLRTSDHIPSSFGTSDHSSSYCS